MSSTGWTPVPEEAVDDVLQRMSAALDGLQVERPGANVAVVTLLGSLCPVTLAHVRCLVEARRMLLAEEPGGARRPARLERFDAALGFISLNGDDHVARKLQAKGQQSLSFAGRKRCVELAVQSHDWLGWEAHEGESLTRLRARWPNLHFVHFCVNGADDVVRYKKWQWATKDERMIAIGRPGATAELEAAVRRAGIDTDGANFVCGPEIPDISSTQVREALASRDTEKLGALLDPAVARWCLENWPSCPLRASQWMQWFLGVRERELLQVDRARFFDADRRELIDSRSGKRWPVGQFDCPTVADLKRGIATRPHRSEADGLSETPLVVMGNVDIGRLQAHLTTEDRAMVQVASNFNCLEVPCRSHAPCSGDLVEGYATDATQGPAASFGVPAASLFRAHFPFHAPQTDPGTWGQTAERQVELLSDARDFFGTCVNGKVTLTGGERPVLADSVADVSAAIRVGVHADVQVVFGRSQSAAGELCLLPEPLALVDQVLAASVNWNDVGLMCPSRGQLESLTRAALRASYEGAYLAAISRGRRVLLLTLVGAGVFGNPRAMVLEELAAAHARWADHPASALREVRLCLFEKEEDVAAEVGAALKQLLDGDGKAGAVRWASAAISEGLVEEKRVVAKFLHEVAQGTGRYCFGAQQTAKAMQMGVVDTLICWDQLDIHRLGLRHPTTGREQTRFVTPEERRDKALLRDTETGLELDVVEEQALRAWAQASCEQLGATLVIVSDRSREGKQFCRGFLGIGGLLRSPIDFDDCSDGSDAPALDSDEDFA